MPDQEWSDKRERLPRVEDLPVVQEGYDPGAVADAFDAFYRHAAKLDATLDVLESVEVFRKEAGDLRADIRALRAAAWGPLPGRQTWAAGYAVRASAERRGGFLDVAPRIAVEAAFIIVVAVGAALAGFSTTTVVLVIVAAWLVVGLAEVIASLTRERAPAPVLRPAPAQPEPEPAQAPTTVQAAPEPEPEPEPEAEAEPGPDPWEAAEEPEPLLTDALHPVPADEPHEETGQLAPIESEVEPEPEEPEPEEPEPEEPEPVAQRVPLLRRRRGRR